MSSSSFSRSGGRGEVWAALPAAACPGTMWGGGRLRGLGGCREGLWRASLVFFGRSPGAGAALTKPLYSAPHHLFVLMAGEGTRSPQKGEAAPPHLLTGIPPGKPRWVTSPRRDWDAWPPRGCRPLLHLESPNVCRTFRPRLTFLSLSFSCFSPFLSLLSPCLPSAASALPGGSLETRGRSIGCPLRNVRSLQVCAFQR